MIVNRGASAADTLKLPLIHKFGRVTFHRSGAIAPNPQHNIVKLRAPTVCRTQAETIGRFRDSRQRGTGTPFSPGSQAVEINHKVAI